MGVPGKTVGVMFTPLTVKYIFYDTERIGGKEKSSFVWCSICHIEISSLDLLWTQQPFIEHTRDGNPGFILRKNKVVWRWTLQRLHFPLSMYLNLNHNVYFFSQYKHHWACTQFTCVLQALVLSATDCWTQIEKLDCYLTHTHTQGQLYIQICNMYLTYSNRWNFCPLGPPVQQVIHDK